ncbi:MAG: hypothetical protein ACK4N5_17525, partial [Myxococcales bacterium]
MRVPRRKRARRVEIAVAHSTWKWTPESPAPAKGTNMRFIITAAPAPDAERPSGNGFSEELFAA